MRKYYIEYAYGESNGISAINNKTCTSRKYYIEYAVGESNGISAINNGTFTSRLYAMECAYVTLSAPTANRMLMVYLR